MSESTRLFLKNLLVSRYMVLRRRLQQRLGSTGRAEEALHETWLRLETMPEMGPVSNADAYLLRMATNAVIDQHRREYRETEVDVEEVDELFEIEDELADPERIVAGRMTVEALAAALEGLTPRRRRVLVAARIHGQTNAQIAARMDISVRLVEKELSEALKYCESRLQDMIEVGDRKGRRKF
jgi:RNA polymerase sigma factor (sigma-70 family)